MRTIHRVTMLFVALFVLYVGATGSLLQAIDLHALITHAPATDPNMLSIREGITGPPGFPVIAAADYGAPALPASLNLDASLATVLKAARSSLGGAPLDYLELRMANGAPVGQVQSQNRLLRFDAATGAALPAPQPQRGRGGPGGPRSPHDIVKDLHRFSTFGNWTGWLDFATGVGLFVMVVSGLLLHFKLMADRAALGRRGLFWSAGGAWRNVHRGVSLVASVFVLVVAVTGILMTIDNLFVNQFIAAGGFRKMAPTASPLADADLPNMLHTTLAAVPGTPIKVIRLRIFAGMPQGVVITGGDTAQLVFNATTGHTAGETEPGYPYSGFPFGWQEHELVKQIHRGDYFGLTGRWMDLLAGLSMVFLSISGMVMYADLYAKRRKLGRSAIFWK